MLSYERFGRIIFLTLVITLITQVDAKTAENIDAFVGRWNYAGATDTPPSSITTTATAANLNLILPDKIKLHDSHTILLSRVNASTFSAKENSGTEIVFTLKSPGKAELTMKGYSAGRWTYLDTDLTRE